MRLLSPLTCGWVCRRAAILQVFLKAPLTEDLQDTCPQYQTSTTFRESRRGLIDIYIYIGCPLRYCKSQRKTTDAATSVRRFSTTWWKSDVVTYIIATLKREEDMPAADTLRRVESDLRLERMHWGDCQTCVNRKSIYTATSWFSHP